jgi:hypothetical protein
MKMNVDLKNDSSCEIGVDVFNHSNASDDNYDNSDGDDDNEEDEEEEDDEAEDGTHDSDSSNILDVTPRDMQINHNSSSLHDMSRIHWPPGSWQDGTRRSAFQPYRVGTVSER